MRRRAGCDGGVDVGGGGICAFGNACRHARVHCRSDVDQGESGRRPIVAQVRLIVPLTEPRVSSTAPPRVCSPGPLVLQSLGCRWIWPPSEPCPGFDDYQPFPRLRSDRAASAFGAVLLLARPTP